MTTSAVAANPAAIRPARPSRAKEPKAAPAKAQKTSQEQRSLTNAVRKAVKEEVDKRSAHFQGFVFPDKADNKSGFAPYLYTHGYAEATVNHLKEQISHIDKRFDKLEESVDERFNKFEKSADERFEQVNMRFDRLERSVDDRFNQVGRRLDTIIYAQVAMAVAIIGAIKFL